MKLSTTATIPGEQCQAHRGLVCGSAVLSRDAFGHLFAKVVNVVGGPSRSYQKLFVKAREDATEMMIERARELGANAIVGVAFDSEWVEMPSGAMLALTVSGTAVISEPVSGQSPI